MRKGFGVLEVILVLVVGLGVVFWQLKRAQKTTAQINTELSQATGSDAGAPVNEQLKILQNKLNQQSEQTDLKADCALDSAAAGCATQ